MGMFLDIAESIKFWIEDVESSPGKRTLDKKKEYVFHKVMQELKGNGSPGDIRRFINMEMDM